MEHKTIDNITHPPMINRELTECVVCKQTTALVKAVTVDAHLQIVGVRTQCHALDCQKKARIITPFNEGNDVNNW